MNNKTLCVIGLAWFLAAGHRDLAAQDRPRIRDLGVQPGILATGKWNAITDVRGVRVGHRSLIEGQSIRTGVTAILRHGDNLFRRRSMSATALARPPDFCKCGSWATSRHRLC